LGSADVLPAGTETLVESFFTNPAAQRAFDLELCQPNITAMERDFNEMISEKHMQAPHAAVRWLLDEIRRGAGQRDVPVDAQGPDGAPAADDRARPSWRASSSSTTTGEALPLRVPCAPRRVPRLKCMMSVNQKLPKCNMCRR
jgi:hypothetical protein